MSATNPPVDGAGPGEPPPSPATPCEAAEREALLALSAEASPDGLAAAASHRAGCPACAATVAATEAMAARVSAALRAAAQGPDLSGPVLRALPAGAPPRLLPGRRTRLRPWLPLAAAAALVALLAGGLQPVLSGRWWWTPPSTSVPPGPDPDGGGSPRREPRLREMGLAEMGLHFRHHAAVRAPRAMYEAVGSGVAVTDLDGDGRPDVFLADSWPLDGERPADGGHRLYRNMGPGFARGGIGPAAGALPVTFEDRTDGSGTDVPERVCGVLAADLDGDGLRDLLLCGYGRLRLLHNEGDLRFRDVSEAAGFLAEPDSWFSCAAAADLDRDGILDLYVTRYADQEAWRKACRALGGVPGKESHWRGIPVFAGPAPLVPQTDRLYRGLGGMRFEDVTATALEGMEPQYGFQVVATDADGDGWIDLYVANDTHPNNLWRNLGGMRFRDDGLASGAAFDADGRAQAGMGIAVGDQGGDGLPDFLVSNFSNDHLTLYRGHGRPGAAAFTDRSYASGVGPASAHFLGWGCSFADVDLDGDEDLLVANGHVYPDVAKAGGGEVSYEERLQYFRAEGETFVDGFPAAVAAAGGGHGAPREELHPLGALDVDPTPRVHRALARCDLDGDGHLDFIATVLGGDPVVLRGAPSPGRWIAFRLRGTKSPRDPAGARVSLVAAGRTQTRELHFGDSYASTSEPLLHFGLGGEDLARRVVVRWPSGLVEEVGDLAAGSVYDLVEGGR